MLTDRKFSLTKKTEDRLKRAKQASGQSINQLANENFFLSLEKNFKVRLENLERPTMGTIKLDKSTWLGECQVVVEVALKNLYPSASPDEAAILWALHVESGI
ncbi:DNA sulfur modification protein DndE [Halomonas sp. 141]|uniref:DndE family protein n=1 Tax=Halomonas sp. 141 TaxID=2056666 RepID=UPI000C2A7954|nr:DndE family protein [Halomonas sp. 141]PJX12559.1 DNA sulfur modification protein DndE [Halomonas sp. 141]